jgi:hypothetical protein
MLCFPSDNQPMMQEINKKANHWPPTDHPSNQQTTQPINQPTDQQYNFQPKDLTNIQRSKQRSKQSTMQPNSRLNSDAPFSASTKLMKFLNQTHWVATQNDIRRSKLTIPNETKATSMLISPNNGVFTDLPKTLQIYSTSMACYTHTCFQTLPSSSVAVGNGSVPCSGSIDRVKHEYAVWWTSATNRDAIH